MEEKFASDGEGRVTMDELATKETSELNSVDDKLIGRVVVRSITDVESFMESDIESTIVESEGVIDSVLEKDSSREDVIASVSFNVKVVEKDEVTVAEGVVIRVTDDGGEDEEEKNDVATEVESVSDGVDTEVRTVVGPVKDVAEMDAIGVGDDWMVDDGDGGVDVSKVMSKLMLDDTVGSEVKTDVKSDCTSELPPEPRVRSPEPRVRSRVVINNSVVMVFGTTIEESEELSRVGIIESVVIDSSKEVSSVLEEGVAEEDITDISEVIVDGIGVGEIIVVDSIGVKVNDDVEKDFGGSIEEEVDIVSATVKRDEISEDKLEKDMLDKENGVVDEENGMLDREGGVLGGESGVVDEDRGVLDDGSVSVENGNELSGETESSIVKEVVGSEVKIVDTLEKVVKLRVEEVVGLSDVTGKLVEELAGTLMDDGVNIDDDSSIVVEIGEDDT